MWIDFKPIYNTLETIFVRGLRLKTPPARAAYSTLVTSRPTTKLFFCIIHRVKTHWRYSQKKFNTIYVWLGKCTSEKTGIFKMKLRLSKSSRLLHRILFLVIVFVSYSRKKLIKNDTSSIRCHVCHLHSIIIYWQSSSQKHKTQYLRISQQKMC